MPATNRILANQAEYLVSCISEVAHTLHLKQHEAYTYLRQHLGVDYLIRHYEALHTLSIDEAVSDVIMVCKRNGGGLG